MPGILDEIIKLKTQAKNRRDWRKYDRAVLIIKDAIALAKGDFEKGQLQSQMAEQLADCYGLLGGVERRWALESADVEDRKQHLVESARAYDNAWAFEQGDYSIVNSYGMLNRLISRLLLEPDSLFSNDTREFGDGLVPLAIREELEIASKRIQEQSALPRQDDYWAAADLALVDVLLEKQDAVSAYASFVEKSPPDYAFKSVLDVLRPLATLQWRVAEQLQNAVKYLDQRAPRS